MTDITSVSKMVTMTDMMKATEKHDGALFRSSPVTERDDDNEDEEGITRLFDVQYYCFCLLSYHV